MSKERRASKEKPQLIIKYPSKGKGLTQNSKAQGYYLMYYVELNIFSHN